MPHFLWIVCFKNQKRQSKPCLIELNVYLRNTIALKDFLFNLQFIEITNRTKRACYFRLLSGSLITKSWKLLLRVLSLKVVKEMKPLKLDFNMLINKKPSSITSHKLSWSVICHLTQLKRWLKKELAKTSMLLLMNKKQIGNLKSRSSNKAKSLFTPSMWVNVLKKHLT